MLQMAIVLLVAVVCLKTDQLLPVPKCTWEGAGDPREFDGECMAGGIYSFDNISDIRNRVHLPTCRDNESLLVPVMTPCVLDGHSCVVAVFTNSALWVGGCVDDSTGRSVVYPLSAPTAVGDMSNMLYNYSKLEEVRVPTVGLIQLWHPCAAFYDSDQRLPICYETNVKAFDDRWRPAFVCCCNQSLCTERIVQLSTRTFNFDHFRPQSNGRNERTPPLPETKELKPREPLELSRTPPQTCCYATSPAPPWKPPRMHGGGRLYTYIFAAVFVFAIGASVIIFEIFIYCQRKELEKQWENEGKAAN